MIDIPWRTGVNMREFAYYELPECRRFPLATPPTREAQLDALKEMGVPLVRFFAAHRAVDFDTNLKQVGKALDLLAARNMQAIVCIGDAIGESGHTIPGDDDFHKDTPMGHFHKRYWNERHYETNYLPYIRLLAEKFADHPAIMIWELGNELALHPRPRPEQPSIEPVSEQDFDNFVEFVKLASHTVKSLSPRKLISTGLINTNQIAPDGSNDEQRARFARKLYGLPTVDLISIHMYAEDAEEHLAMIDVKAAQDPQINKPIYIGELGAHIEKTQDRPSFIRSVMKAWKAAEDRNAFSVVLWAFDNSPFPPDSGVADGFGFARRHQQDFDAIKDIIREFAGVTEPFILEEATHPELEPEPGRSTEPDLRRISETRFTKSFRVVTEIGVRIRRNPTRFSPKRGLLELDEIVLVDPNSRTEVDEHVWWEHDRGWSAERPLEGSDVSLLEIAATDEPRRADARLRMGGESRFSKTYQVVTSKLLIRGDHDENAENLGSFENGDTVMVDPASRHEGSNFIWWEHNRGWSAERPLVGNEVFLFEVTLFGQQDGAVSPFMFPLEEGEPLNVNTLPHRDRLFRVLPVNREQVRVLQQFGNTRFAFDGGLAVPPRPGKGFYDRFFQGLHPGIDLGNRDKEQIVPVFSGISDHFLPKVVRIIRDSYSPVGVRVQAGPYAIIYGHLRDDEELVAEGTILTAETPIGNIASRSDIIAFNAAHPDRFLGFEDSPHLHLEIRFQFNNETTILNPLLFFTDAVRETLAHKQPSSQEQANFRQQFYVESEKDPIWTKWGEPFAQAVIRKEQPLIGPRAKLTNG